MKHLHLSLLLIGVLLFNSAKAQIPSSIIYPDITCTNPGQCGYAQYVHATFYDTLTETLYIAGDFNDASGTNRRKLAAIDLRTGNVLAWNPIVNNGIVNAICKTGNTVYIGGTFTQVNSTAKNYLAAINATTGALLAWNPNPNASVSSLFTDGTYLFVGGNFTNISAQAHTFLAVYNVPGNTLNGTQPNISAAYTDLDQATYYNLKIYFRSDNSNGGNSIFSTTINPGPVTQLMDASTDSISDYAISNNKLYCTGGFYSINGQSRNFCAAYNLSTSTLLTWNPSPPNNGTCRYNIELHRDTAIIACQSYMAEDTNYHYIKKYTTTGTGNYLGTIKYYQTNLYDPHGTYFNAMIAGKDKLIEVGKKHFHGPYRNDSISSYCFKPNMPNAFTAAPSPVCQGQTGVIYTLPIEPYFNSYSWNYSGTGATIIGNSNSITIDFSANATSGTLSVYGINYCGMSGPSRSIAITINPSPNANAGSDLTLNCNTAIVTLNGSSTSNPVSYNWSGPNSFNATFPTPTTTAGGTYILTITNTTSGCTHSDTMQVMVDTVKPTIDPFTGNYQLTCTTNQVILDGSTINSSDSLRWTGPSNFSSADPATAVNPGNYILTAIDSVNGCVNSDTITITVNNQLPNITIPLAIDTLTCSLDTIVLDGSSTDANTILFWIDLNNDTLSDPANVTTGGTYLLVVTDTSSGCSSSGTVIVQQFITPPNISIVSGNYNLNCSVSSVLLDGNSQTPNSILSWSGPNNFSSPDPAFVTQIGNYLLLVTDPVNGCTSIDSVPVGYQQLLLMSSSNDTLICNGSGVSIFSNPIGGSPPINYSWSNGSSTSTISISPTDTINYIVQVTDGSGCVGTDTITILVPAPISDSVLTFKPCDSNSLGQIQIYPYGGIAPYSYSIDNGNTFQSSQIFQNLNYGNYNFIIRDSLGCTKNLSASISTTSQLPEPEFLVSTNMMTLDTFVLVDISNPRPDSVNWIFPLTCTMINTDLFSPVIVNSDTGTFSITMNAFYGSCMLSLTKNINVQLYDTAFADPFNNNGIQSVTLYPNPNNGQFTVNVQLYKKQSFAIMVYDAAGVEHFRTSVNESDNFSGNVNLQQPVPGTYVLKVIAEYDAKEAAFIISQ